MKKAHEEIRLSYERPEVSPVSDRPNGEGVIEDFPGTHPFFTKCVAGLN